MTQATAASHTANDSSAHALVSLRAQVARDGFAFVAANAMQSVLGGFDALTDWPQFAASWNDLLLDTYLPDGHRYRRRRHATLSARAGETTARLEPHQPHYQSVDYNPLVGGIERWFEPMHAEILNGVTMQRVLAFCCSLFGQLKPLATSAGPPQAHRVPPRGAGAQRPGANTPVDWKIECHQFRIEARADAFGQPTPEGMHRDGVDYVLVLLVNRTNIKSGTTSVHDLNGNLLGSFTLTAPLDAALVDDARVKHGVTAVEPIDGTLAAYRDVLVVTFKAK